MSRDHLRGLPSFVNPYEISLSDKIETEFQLTESEFEIVKKKTLGQTSAIEINKYDESDNKFFATEDWFRKILESPKKNALKKTISYQSVHIEFIRISDEPKKLIFEIGDKGNTKY